MLITCKTKDKLPLHSLCEFQGGLKKRTKDDFEKIKKSIYKYGFAVPFFVWKHDGINYVLDGHGRYGALKSMEMAGEIIPDLPVVFVNLKNEEDAKNLLLRINSSYGMMSKESVADFLQGIDVDINDLALPDGVIDLSDLDKEVQDKTRSSLRDQFLLPPFSVIDSRTGEWQQRKRQWKSIGLHSDEGRDVDMLKNLAILSKKIGGGKKLPPTMSIFDPVLCEIMYSWFCMPKGAILDPFAGGSVRGVVASFKNMDYTGIDIRHEQIDANERQRYICRGNEYQPRWICGDSLQIDELLPPDYQCDLVFSCPPYADLEVYSDLDGDISNKSYADFITAYTNIIKGACNRLRNNRFAVFVVGEVRDKAGAYKGFVSDTIRAFYAAGLSYYNEIVLITSPVGKCFTAGHDMKLSRKVSKVHQNVLAFIKGDADESCKIHEKVCVFLKGNGKQASGGLGDVVCDDVVLPS